MNCACSWYPGLEAIIICSLNVFMVTTAEEHILGQTTCMTDEYTFNELLPYAAIIAAMYVYGLLDILWN